MLKELNRKLHKLELPSATVPVNEEYRLGLLNDARVKGLYSSQLATRLCESEVEEQQHVYDSDETRDEQQLVYESDETRDEHQHVYDSDETRDDGDGRKEEQNEVEAYADEDGYQENEEIQQGTLNNTGTLINTATLINSGTLFFYESFDTCIIV